MKTVGIIFIIASLTIILWGLFVEIRGPNAIVKWKLRRQPCLNTPEGQVTHYFEQAYKSSQENVSVYPVSGSLGQLSKAYDPSCEICDKKVPGKFHLITNFFPVSHPKWAASVGEKGANDDKRKLLQERVIELLDVLQHNLNNELITAVHILYDHPYSMIYLMKANLRHKDKLVFHRVPGEITYRCSVEYIQNYLLGRAVIYLNQDIYIGQGLEKVNTETLEKKHIAYALSRRGRTERYCTMPDPCGPGQPYIGSHDTYIYVQTNKYSEAELKSLDFKMDNYGAENVFIHFLANVGKFRVLNPCYVLFSYHVHCRHFHSVDRPRINGNGRSGGAAFTDALE